MISCFRMFWKVLHVEILPEELLKENRN